MTTQKSWAEVVAPSYFALIAQGVKSDDAAEALKAEYPEAIGGLTVGSITRGLRRWASRLTQDLGDDDVVGSAIASSQLRVPPPLGEVALSTIDIEYQDGHVWCDTHIPLHLDKLMNLSLDRARVDGVKRLYCGGDLMDCAFASKFVNWGQANPLEVRQQFEIARRTMDAVLSVFDEMYLVPGNHDGTRFKFMSRGSLGFREFMEMVLGPSSGLLGTKVHICETRYMVLRNSPRGDWRITHPQNARAVPLSLAQTLALKHKQNILTGHQHYFALGGDRWGGYILCDGGHMQDESLTNYKREMDNAYSSWTPGYVELFDGWPSLVPMPAKG